MHIFGRKRESLVVKKARSCRALYMNGPGTEEIEIHLITEEGHRLDLQVPPHIAAELIGQLTDAYEAVNPPLGRRNNRAASWDGEGT